MLANERGTFIVSLLNSCSVACPVEPEKNKIQSPNQLTHPLSTLTSPNFVEVYILIKKKKKKRVQPKQHLLSSLSATSPHHLVSALHPPSTPHSLP
jgi:hypothetical protein